MPNIIFWSGKGSCFKFSVTVRIRALHKVEIMLLSALFISPSEVMQFCRGLGLGLGLGLEG